MADRLLTPAERRNYLALCREHGTIVTGFFERGESDLIGRNAVVRKIRRELDWYIDLQQRRWRKLEGRKTPTESTGVTVRASLPISEMSKPL